MYLLTFGRRRETNGKRREETIKGPYERGQAREKRWGGGGGGEREQSQSKANECNRCLQIMYKNTGEAQGNTHTNLPCTCCSQARARLSNQSAVERAVTQLTTVLGM